MLKIPPHITEVQRPTNKNAKIPTGTCAQIKLKLAQSIPGTLTVMSVGANIPNETRSKVKIDTVVSIARLDTLIQIEAPTKRPTIIKAQYTATIKPAVAALIPNSGVFTKYMFT